MEPEPAPVEEAPQPAYEDDGAEAVPVDIEAVGKALEAEAAQNETNE